MSRKKILLIDDERDFVKLLKINLEATTTHELLVAHSGQEALELLDTTEPDLILLDIIMPGMDGIQVLKRIKAMKPQIPVAMVTAVWDEQEAKRCFQEGACDYVTKPVDPDYLKQVLLAKLS